MDNFIQEACGRYKDISVDLIAKLMAEDISVTDLGKYEENN